MDIKMLPPSISKLIGGYDHQLKLKADMGCLGETELQCYNRFLNDLDRSKNDRDFPYIFDSSEVKRVLEFCSLLVGYDAQGNLQKLKLYPWQKFVVLNLFGWRHKQSKLLRYRESYISVARRNGKSALSSVLLHYFMAASTFRSERAICFSVKKDSAKIVFRQFLSYIDADPDLDALYNYSKINGNATCKGTDNYLEVFSGSTDADGFQSGYAVADEIALQDGQLYQLIYDGQANLPQSQLIGISTAGFDIGGWCHSKYKGIKASLASNTLLDNLFVYICEPDEGDDFADYRTWAKANPLLFFTIDGQLRQDKIDYYSSKYQQALVQGGRNLTSFYTKQCNHWCAAADTLLCDFNALDKCIYDFTFEEVLEKYKNWYCGVDLSQTTDLTSVAWLAWIKISEDGKLLAPDSNDGKRAIYINVLNYMPSATLQRHITADKFPYEKYIDKELFLTFGAKGARTAYDEILIHMQKIREDNDLKFETISCDPYGVASIQASLEEMCNCLILQSQSPKALSPYIELFATYVVDEQIAISKDSSDIFYRAIRNSVVAQTKDGYLEVKKPTQNQNTNYRIDPVDAMLDGIIAPIIDKDKIIEAVNYDDLVNDWLDIYK